MGGDNKHLYSFVESHMSRDLGVSLAIASLSELIWEHLLVVISSANASQELKIKLNIIWRYTIGERLKAPTQRRYIYI